MAQLILPGDPLPEDYDSSALGPGMYQVPLHTSLPVKAGMLTTKQPKRGDKASVLYVETNSKRYIATAKDQVIGVITAKNSEGYRVTLQDHTPPVRLDQFAFENASKKNKPNLSVGSLVYARVVHADKDIEAEVECFDATTGKAAGFGELKGGYLFEVSLGYARKLLFEGHQVLNEIGHRTPYEIVIGMNGKVWVDAGDRLTIWKIAKCIQKAEHTDEDLSKLVSKTLSA